MNIPDVPFESFPKIPRLLRDCVITEKIDGTNASVLVTEEGEVFAASRKRWITPEADNFGFAAFVEAHADELRELGPGRHFGEWYGRGIQRGYGLDGRRFALFNARRWNAGNVPACCSVVPVLYEGTFDSSEVALCLRVLARRGSYAVPGFANPEGVVVFLAASHQLYKATLDGDGAKGAAAAADLVAA